jgi:hypothetical protein
MYKNRTTADGATPTDTTSADQISNGNLAYGAAGASPGVIVPPVIVSGGNADAANAGLGIAQSAFDFSSGVLGDAVDSFQFITAGLFGQNSQLIDSQTGITNNLLDQVGAQPGNILAALAAAGSPPQPASQNPTPIAADVPVPTPAPAPAPAPASPAADPCTGTYPFLNEATGECYTVACASGTGTRRKGRWHLYKNAAHDQWMGPTC